MDVIKEARLIKDREPLIIDTGATTKRIRRIEFQHPDVWKLTYSTAWTTRHNDYIYALEYVNTYWNKVCFFLGSYDLDELIEEARARGLQGVRGVV